VSDDLTATRPYLLRAMHEWMNDNGQTPLLMVDADYPNVMVPEGFIEDGHIVLNVSWSATRNLQLENESISFEARFSGSPYAVNVPIAAVKGIYARESGQGMMFQEEPGAEEAGEEGIPTDAQEPEKKPGRPGLRVVK
jgi:stringent starvation protein B